MKNKFKKLTVTALTAAFITYAAGPVYAASGEIYTEPPAYMDVVELINEFGQSEYIERSNQALIDQETARIAAAKEAMKDQDGSNGGEVKQPTEDTGKDTPEKPAPNKDTKEEPETPTNKDTKEEPYKEHTEDASKNKGVTDSAPKKKEGWKMEKVLPGGQKQASKSEGTGGSKTGASNPSTSVKEAPRKSVSEGGTKSVAHNKAAATESKAGAAKSTVKSSTATKTAVPSYSVKAVSEKTKTDFIEKVSKDIQAVSEKEGLYSSLMIAQAMMATNSGQSYLASADMNNLMGLKGSYKGQSALLNSSEGKQEYKVYGSVKEGFQDYVDLMNKDIYKASLKKNASTVKDAVKAVSEHYATDKDYASKLNNLIDTYDLQKFDK